MATSAMMRAMWTLSPLLRLARRRLAPGMPEDIRSCARRSWEIAKAESVSVSPAYCLPDQLQRVTGWVFGPEAEQRASLAGCTRVHAATRAYLVEDAIVLDGTVYKGAIGQWLAPRAPGVPRLSVDREIGRGASFASPHGVRWFGMWLIDDCVTYRLAIEEGVAIAPEHAVSAHMRTYEAWLGMQSTRTSGALVRELVLFDDVGHNRSKRERFAANRARLRARVEAVRDLATSRAPGVVLLRGHAGDRRVLANELELAEHLRRTRGFAVIDPMTEDLATILGACAGADTIVGVEGSALAHGLAVLAPGASLLVLQPPNRFCALYKDLTDRDGQPFAFVVGRPAGESFTIARDELERTLDLLPAAVDESHGVAERRTGTGH